YVINLLIIYSLIIYSSLFFFNDPATTDIYTLSLHDALPICSHKFVALELSQDVAVPLRFPFAEPSILFFEQLQVENLHTLHNNLDRKSTRLNSSHVKISYAVFCLKKKNIANCNISCYV